MSAFRILLLVLGLAVVGFVAKYAISGSVFGGPPEKTEPARQLENVRQRSQELERELQQKADRAELPQEP